MSLFIISLMAVLILAGSTAASPATDSDEHMHSGDSNLVSEEQTSSDPASEKQQSSGPGETARRAVDFDHELDSYEPLKDRYNFYFTYKTVHPWWDAVALGMEEAQRQYLDRGVTITYEYMAPEGASAEDQTRRLLMAEQQDYDVIGVDVADESIISPIIDELVDSGVKVMTFSSSDAAEGCKRIAYVGNTHNYQDGKDLAEALCEKLGFKGKVAILVGSVGAPCHEDRARGARDAIAKYEGMEIVATEYDMDSVDKAYDLTMQILKDTPDLDGIICCNMSNPVGAARAITERESSAVIVGMDHDKEALRCAMSRLGIQAGRWQL